MPKPACAAERKSQRLESLAGREPGVLGVQAAPPQPRDLLISERLPLTWPGRARGKPGGLSPRHSEELPGDLRRVAGRAPH